MEESDGLTYAEAGVDIDREAEAIEALIEETGEFSGDYAGFVDIGDRYLAVATDCVGTKILVADAVGDFSTLGIDAIAMNVNDLLAGGFTPTAFVDYLAVAEPDPDIFREIGEGLAIGAELGEVALLGGETSVIPEIVTRLDLAGTAVGLAAHDELLSGTAAPGDVLVGVPSNGIHANGLTLARAAATRNHDFEDPFPGDESISVGDALLEPTRIYSELREPLQTHDVTGAAHITGGGWLNLFRLGKHRYVVDNPFEPHAIFDFVQTEGQVAADEMYRTFNMGTGFVISLEADAADSFVRTVTDASVIGEVHEGDATVEIADLSMTP